jgi:RimJ/RimL family protein N-acetyltransferase
MRKDPHQFLFAIKVIDGARTIGTCSLMGVDGKNRRATLGLSIADPAAQGQGYGFEAMTLLLEFGFLELNLNRIQLLVMQYNERAIRLYERLGFQREAVLRQAFYREGRYWDEYIMSLLRCEYQPRDGWNLEQGVTP